ncbi:uncharacterized protein JCM6883_005661 [Sporobolomyces salmoneus]|uniref:uncharacterized protein n=1 Tax=Sporobolomyces salmoneus TaxID=183962 RepID=UPI00317F1742
MIKVSSEEPRQNRSSTRAVLLQIDRLSLLPNELLDKIFDYAHTLDQPFTGPLSKRLLPFHITGIYRQMKVSKVTKLLRLAAKLNAESYLREVVRALQVDGTVDLDKFGEFSMKWLFGPFLKRLRKLEDLRLDHPKIAQMFYRYLEAQPLSLRSSLFPNLRSLRVCGGSRRTPQFPLIVYGSLDPLVNLEYENYIFPYGHLQFPDGPLARDLTRLSIIGAYADDVAIGSFCSRCFNLTSLRLKSVNSHYEDLIQALPTRLTELELIEEGVGPAHSFCDHLLPRFTRLRRLHIGHTLFSEVLATHVAHLSLLEHLELGRGSISINRLHPLVSGPTRLPSLQTLHLSLIPYEIGTRIEVDEDGSLTSGELPVDGYEIGDDWHLAEFEGEEGDEYTVKGLAEFVRLAKEEGIEIEGPILKAGEARQAYLLEVANIAVYRSWMRKDFGVIFRLQNQYPQLCQRIPLLDFDSLDPTKLKLVKKELPDENWFSLTLEN